MAKVSKVHTGKQPIRRHFLAEWLEARSMTPSDLIDALNDPDRSFDLPEVDKSQVYRWLKGQMPQAAAQMRLAGILNLNDPGDLLRHPDDDWFREFVQNRSREELERMKTMLQAAFPRDKKTGTGE